MKIDTKPLEIGKDWTEVAGTWSQQDQADELMITSLETQTHKGMLESLKADRKFMKQAMAFFKDLFGLTQKQADQIFTHVKGQTLSLYVTYVCGAIKGADGQSFAEFEKAVKDSNAPKEQSATTAEKSTNTNKK